MKYSPDEIQEQRKLLERLSRSKVFEGKRERFRLLEYLFEKALRDERVSDYEIVERHLGVSTPTEADAAKIRQMCGNLRKSLEEFAAIDVYRGPWRFSLPTTKGLGYELSILNLNAEMGAVGRFWRAHIDPPRPAIFIYDEPLFFRDEYAGTVVRQAQFETMDEVNEQYAAKVAQTLGESSEVKMQPCHLYTLAGEIGARDRILDMLAEEYGLKVEKKVSRMMRDISDLADVTPIIVGNNRNNKILRQVTELHQFGRFGYFVEAQRFRTVEIRNYTPTEREWLSARYAVEDDGRNLLLKDDPRPDKVVFCVVTRMPNPYDKETPITLLSASYSKVLEVVAQTLTTESFLSEQLDKTDLPKNAPFPRYFQGLFSIRLGATGADDRPHRPVLRCWRWFNRFREDSGDE